MPAFGARTYRFTALAGPFDIKLPAVMKHLEGAYLPGSPLASDSASYDRITIFFVVVPNWSDRTPMPPHK